MLLAVSVQGVAAATPDLRGPEHYHETAARAPTVPQAQHRHEAHHPHHIDHGREEVRRHYHLPGEGAVLVQDHRHDDDAAIERTAKRKSAIPAFLAVIPQRPSLAAPDLGEAFTGGRRSHFLSCIPRRIERPPRHHPA